MAKTHTITLGGKDYSVTWNHRAEFRQSAMGFETFDPNRQTAWFCAHVAAMVGADSPKQIFSAEDISGFLSEMEQDEKDELIATIKEAREGSKKPAPTPERGHGSESAAD